MPKLLKKILIIEDEKPMSKAIELKLSHAGYNVKVVNDGMEWLKILEWEKFDLILVDLIMPKLDGFGVLSRLKEMWNKTPVIVLSNLSQEDDENKAKSLGAIGFFSKLNTPISDILSQVTDIFKK